jgi:hypothetical protein
MGVSAFVSGTKYPEQDKNSIGKRVGVYFNYNTETKYLGTMLRYDKTEPYQCIIQLDDGRVVLATECQYSFEKD